MMWSAVFVLILVPPVSLSNCHDSEDTDILYDVFSEDFIWATATSAHQIEGAWDADGKGENIWDRRCHTEGTIEDGHTGDVACDSYNNYMDDVGMLQQLKVDSYRFSIAWSRILPSGTLTGGVNEQGVQYYDNLINALVEAGIRPIVTLYHWDLPQPLQDIGGLENEELVEHFRDYADVCFDRFGDRVDMWITFNEPWVVAWLGYGDGVFAPSIGDDPGNAPYRVTHTILKSHAEAWHLFNDMYRQQYPDSKISITLDSGWFEPKTAATSDVLAAERGIQFKLGWYANAIFGSGDYPEVMRQQVEDKSEAQGLNKSRLPEFTPGEIDRIKGTFDFFGLNHYTTSLVSHLTQDSSCVSYICDQDTKEEADPSWPETGSGWLKMVPWGLRSLLRWIKKSYGDVPILITENGCSDRNSSIEDTHRVNFLTSYINQALKANKSDNVNMMGYTAWSLMDNFEWNTGYNEKFGIFHVDFNDPNRQRTPKRSAEAYAKIISDNGFIDESAPSAAQRQDPPIATWFLLIALLIAHIRL